MAVERAAGGTSLIDVLDRVLDKGIVIDAWVRVSLVGIDLITVEARVVVASIDTYFEVLGSSGPGRTRLPAAGGADGASERDRRKRRPSRGAGSYEGDQGVQGRPRARSKRPGPCGGARLRGLASARGSSAPVGRRYAASELVRRSSDWRSFFSPALTSRLRHAASSTGSWPMTSIRYASRRTVRTLQRPAAPSSPSTASPAPPSWTSC